MKDRINRGWVAPPEVNEAVARMRAFAEEHPEADTQGITDGEWVALARAALNIPQPPEWDE